jgi:single-stranded-DNA-specific exonuclease
LGGNTINDVLRIASRYGFLRIIPSTRLDSLLAAGILWSNLNEHGIEAVLSINTRNIIEGEKPLLLIDLPPISGSSDEEILYIGFNGKESISAHIAYFLDKIYGVSTNDHILSLIGGIYRRLDSVEGFKGLESEIMAKLREKGILDVEPGFRFWGRLRLNLAKSIYRTLIPYIPGYTGDPENIDKLLEKIFGKIKNAVKVVDLEQNKELAARFIENLINTMSIDRERAKHIIRRLLGNIYVARIREKSLELNEVMGYLDLYLSLGRNNPLRIAMSSIDPNILLQIIGVSEDLIDELIIDLSITINTYIENGKNILEVEDSIRRPEIIIDAIEGIGLLSDKPLILIINGESITAIHELLRVGYDPKKLYEYCDDKQLCRVKEDGSISKA